MPPDPLYHYTDQAGLLGIVRSGELWATKIQYMNDTMEFGIVVSIAKRQIKKRLKDVSETDRNLYQWVIDDLDQISHVNVCSVSFCHDADLLSQWRGYSGSGVGFAIGFTTTNLLEAALKERCRLGRCIYDETDQVRIIDELIDQMTKEAANHLNNEFANLQPPPLGKAFETALIKYGAFFKDCSFKEEDEWQIVTELKYYYDTAFDFRTGKSMLIPYYRFDVQNGSWRNKIVDVVVGPCPYPESSKKATEALLLKNYVVVDGWVLGPPSEHPPVRLSKIPYRSW